MRKLCYSILPATLIAMTLFGCSSEPKKEYTAGPTVDAFTGRLVHNGKPVSFAAEEKVVLRLMHEKGDSFGVRIKPDGSFVVGWMPIGSYSALLERNNISGAKKSAPIMYSVPNGLAIKEGQTEYQIELGKNWKQ